MKPLNQWSPSEIQEMLKKIAPKIWGVIAVGILGAACFVYFIVIPAWITRTQIKSEIAKIQGQMKTTQSLLLKQPELIKDKATFLKLSEEVKQRLYKPGESSLLLGVISKMAQESQVAVVASNPKEFQGKFPAPFDTQYEAKAYDFTVEGGYHELAQFVSKIESNSKILRVQRFNMLPQEKTPDKHLSEIGLTAVSTKETVG